MNYFDKPRILSSLLGTMFFLLLPHVGRLPLLILIILAAACGYRYAIYRYQLYYPAKYISALMVVGSIVAIYFSFGRFRGLDVMVAFFCVMMMLKLVESRSDRDALVVICLGYLLTAISFLFTQDMWVFAYLLIASVLLTTILMGVQQVDGLFRWRKSVITSAKLVGLALPLSVVFFVVFPRGSGSLWSLDTKGLPQSGISDYIDFSSISKLNKNDDIAFRVDFSSLKQLSDRYYWRGIVFSHFDGKGWKPGYLIPHKAVAKLVAKGPTVDYTITLEAHRRPWIFSLDMPVNTYTKSVINNERQMVLKRKRKVNNRLQYSLQSAPQFSMPTPLLRRERKMYLQYPTQVNSEMIEVGRKWRTQYSKDSAYVSAVLDHIRNNQFYYTLSPGRLDPNRPFYDFWFNKRRGFCEHYASTFALLMRAGGVPSRLVGGYHGGELNPLDNYLIVRQSNAHVWVEVFIQGKGWIRVDPTAAIAAERTEQSLQNETLKRSPTGEEDFAEFKTQREELSNWQHFQYQLDSIDHRWNDWILTYDEQKQNALFEWLGNEKIRRYWLPLFFGIICVSGLAVYGLFWRIRRRKHDKVSMAYLKFCDKLAKKGTVRKSYEGPDDFINRAKQEHPELSIKLDSISKLYISLRFCSPADTAKLEILFVKAVRLL